MTRLKHLTAKHVVYLLISIWAIACFAFYQGCYHYHFFYQEQNQLFLWSADYLTSYFQKPAWLACMAGDFLTQFYYYLYAGPAILTATCLLVGDLSRRALQEAGLKGIWKPYGIAIILMTLTATFSLHYAYRLSSVIALAGGAGVFWLYALLRKGMQTILQRHGKKATDTTLHIGIGIDISMTIVSMLITFWMFGYGVWLFMVLCILHIVCHPNCKQWGILTAIAISLCLLPLSKRTYYLNHAQLLSYPGLGKPTMPQWELEKTLSIDCEYYFGNYEKVKRMVETATERNQHQLFFYNLVLAQQKMLPGRLLAYPNNYLGTFEKIGPNSPGLVIKNMNELYWVLGDMTFAERAAMLSLVSSPGNRNIRMIKRLAEINLVSGDKQATAKYLHILQKTFVWKHWATNVLATTPQRYIEKTKYSNTADTLRLSDNAYTIMQELLESNPDNKVALDYLLCSDLLLKDIDTFKHDYDTYYLKQKAPAYEKLYQEALMVYLAGTNATPEEWQRYIRRADLYERFNAYNKQRGSINFNDTYWYYFDQAKTPTLNN